MQPPPKGSPSAGKGKPLGTVFGSPSTGKGTSPDIVPSSSSGSESASLETLAASLSADKNASGTITGTPGVIPSPPGAVTSLRGHTAVYGGSFDPPHMAHQMACLYLLQALEADQVWLVPTYQHAFGKGLANFAARAAMCELLVAPFGGRVQVLDVERTLGGQSLTHITLTHLAQAHPDTKLALALGADIMADTHRWHQWDEIVERWPVVVVGRMGFPHPQSRIELPAIASRAVRDRVRQNKSLTGLVPASVARFIEQSRLYADTPEP